MEITRMYCGCETHAPAFHVRHCSQCQLAMKDAPIANIETENERLKGMLDAAIETLMSYSDQHESAEGWMIELELCYKDAE